MGSMQEINRKVRVGWRNRKKNFQQLCLTFLTKVGNFLGRDRNQDKKVHEVRSADLFKGKHSSLASFKYIFFVSSINCIGRCVLKASAEFHLTDDGCGVVWRNPSSQQWSSDESDTAWDVFDEGQVREESRGNDPAKEEPENWDEDENIPTSDGHSFCTANKKEVCWDSVNDCKFWNGKDWSELEESGAQDELEEEHSMNIHYRDNVTVQQESDGSLNNDSDNNDIDDLVWIIENSAITDTNPS